MLGVIYEKRKIKGEEVSDTFASKTKPSIQKKS